MANELQLRQMALAPVGSAEAYIHAVNQIPLLSAEEEYELACKHQQDGDLEAARRLVLSHLRYVVRIANGYLGYGLPLTDLIQEGSIGLMKAVKRFDPTMGVRLVSFAGHWIKAEILEYIVRNWRIVKIATTKAQRKLFFNLRSIKKHLGWLTQEKVAAVAQELSVPPAAVLQMEARLSNADVPLETQSSDDHEHSVVPIHYLEDKQADPLHQLEHADTASQGQEQLQVALSKLDERSKHILAVRWLNENKSTLQELAEQYQVSPERIRQIEKNAMGKLKKTLLEAG